MNATNRIQAIAHRLGYRILKGPGPTGLALARLTTALPYHAGPPVVISNAELARAIQETPRLHMGCGQIIASGHINIDSLEIATSEPHAAASGPSNPNKRYYLQCEITQQLQLPPESLNTIYSAHFLEHLDFSKANALLEQGFQAMKPGGCLRLVMPDLRTVVSQLSQTFKQLFPLVSGQFPE